jgi:molybdate transport system substrate-binding protein
VVAGVAMVAALALAGCGSSKGDSSGATPAVGSSSTAVTGTVTVLAASSLTGTFNQIGKDFEAANPGAKVTFSYGGSSTLAQQINQGAPADVFASASPTNMQQVSDAGGLADQPTTFVKNQLVIAVPKGDPKNIHALPDLTSSSIKVAECAAAVPCGAAAQKAIAAAGVKITPVTLEQDVKSALSKLTLGEVDAALVYRTDAIAAGDQVQGIEFTESAQAINEYPIATLKHASNPAGAKAFEQFVLSSKELAVLTQAGFQKP